MKQKKVFSSVNEFEVYKTKEENKMKNSVRLKKVKAITEITVIGITDALVNGPVVRPVVRLVQTGKLIYKTAKTSNVEEVEDNVMETMVNMVV